MINQNLKQMSLIRNGELSSNSELSTDKNDSMHPYITMYL
jgi:hypothetical protein